MDCLKEFAELNSSDISCKAALFDEFRLWKAKWVESSAKVRPSTAIDAMVHADRMFFPITRTLIQASNLF